MRTFAIPTFLSAILATVSLSVGAQSLPATAASLATAPVAQVIFGAGVLFVSQAPDNQPHPLAAPSQVALLRGTPVSVKQLQDIFSSMVGRWSIPFTQADEALWQARAASVWSSANYHIDVPQFVVVVDANLKVQRIALMIASPDRPWVLIGVSKVSTGQPGRFDHYLTPPGVYAQDGTVLDYRAEGTRNIHGIRGLGSKGMRVWDFGWQWAQPGWKSQPDPRRIRLMMHATDPDYIEPRLGHAASKGCIHVADGLNRFMDKLAVLDRVNLDLAATSPAHREFLAPAGTPILPGEYLIVTDAPPSAQ